MRLIRAEPAGKRGIMLVYADAHGEEHTWLMEQTSVAEFLALLLKGRMKRGRRVVIDNAEVSIEPPEKPGGLPVLCVAIGPLESCATLSPAALKGLRAEIDAMLRQQR